MKNQKGTSLVSVIVSFAVLMVVMLLLQVSITASGRYAAEADKVWKQVTAAENHYTNGEGTSLSGGTGVSIEMQLGGTTEDWGTLTIKETDTSDTEYKMYYVK
ncbi:MAG: hypothetical protein HDQ96_11785 [Lachnospiraceae bacterium]|nr:hypothetical protein [Lachnospiraceae bacterium]